MPKLVRMEQSLRSSSISAETHSDQSGIILPLDANSPLPPQTPCHPIRLTIIYRER